MNLYDRMMRSLYEVYKQGFLDAHTEGTDKYALERVEEIDRYAEPRDIAILTALWIAGADASRPYAYGNQLAGNTVSLRTFEEFKDVFEETYEAAECRNQRRRI